MVQTRGGVTKSGALEHKSGNVYETRKKAVKIDEKLLWRAYRNSQPQPKIAIAIILGTGKATECKFGRYIHSDYLNQIP